MLLLQYLKKKGCASQNCLITRNPRHKSSVSDFDMVFFIGENKVINYVKQVEPYRTPQQMYTLLIAEPPHLTPDFTYLADKINWTMSYRRDADMGWSYGNFFNKTTGKCLDREHKWANVNMNEVTPWVANSNIPVVVKNKTKMIAWAVSNCDRVQSYRMELANELKKYIQVDVFGSCGGTECSKAVCDDIIEGNYFFYLSFENALCKDYITEKTFHKLKRTVIPVVYSGASLTEILPPKSYINAEDYDTPEELAKYLLYLANNPEEYQKYFWWKEFYYAQEVHYSCSLCDKINQWDADRSRVRTRPYASIERWYKSNSCREPKIKFPH